MSTHVSLVGGRWGARGGTGVEGWYRAREMGLGGGGGTGRVDRVDSCQQVEMQTTQVSTRGHKEGRKTKTGEKEKGGVNYQ